MAREHICQAAWEKVFANAREAHSAQALEQAEQLYQIALAGAVNLNLEKTRLANLLLCIGQLQIEKGNWKKAEESITECINVYGISDRSLQIEKAAALRFLSEVLRRQGRMSEASFVAGESNFILNEARTHLERCLSLQSKDATAPKIRKIWDRIFAFLASKRAQKPLWS